MESHSPRRTVFIVDDDRGLLRLMEKVLQREGFATASAASGAEALKWLERERADLLLLDLKLQDVEGRELISRIFEIRRQPFVIITGQGDERIAVDMMKRGALDYLVKDVDFLQFLPEIVRRVLEQLETERRLAAAEEQVNLIQSVVEQGFSAVLIVSPDLPDPKVLYINPAFTRLTGYAPADVVNRPLSALGALTEVQQRLRHGVPEEERFVEEVATYQTAGGERWGEWRVGPVKDRTGRITHWLIILRDLTERKRLEREILEISDREQRRLGQDLHDGLCQHLAGIELMSQALEQKLATRSKPEAERVGEIARYVRDAISQTRLLARGLSPVTLESEGLMSALQEFASNAEKIFGIQCRFECAAPVLVHDPAMATHLFRIAQEAVSNAIKHGKATRVVIRLREHRGKAVLSITDNGSGFPAAPARQEGMGLRIMKSRAGMVGGTLATTNNPGGGATVTCSVPVRSSNRKHRESNGRKKEKAKR